MLYLTILMAERVGFVIICAFLLVNIPAFRRLLFARNFLAKLQLVIIFSLFAIMANLIGIEIDPQNELHNKILLTEVSHGYSVVNARILAVTTAGIIGGPGVGASVGFIAGMHRAFQAGFASESLFYIPSSVLIGLLSGYLYKDKNSSFTAMTPLRGFIVGLSMETLQMAFVFLFSPMGWKLVRYIGIPMILISSLGTSIFISIITVYLRQEEETKAMQTHSVLTLANQTLPYFRHGLNRQSAEQVVKIIKKYTNFDAISITDRNKILAHIGIGSDHHIPGKTMVTTLSEQVIQTEQVKVVRTAEEIGCSHVNCPLQAAIVVPLKVNNEAAGTLKMYYVDSWKLTPVEIQLATGLGEIFASQIALGEAEMQANLVRDAEIKSLQAQVNPHFFFNAINTISAMMRRDSNKARQLLLQLSTYFRANLVGARETQITLAQEREHVNAYLSLETTRFPGKYKVDFSSSVSDDVLLPPFAVQVLLENAIKHAFSNRKTGNKVKVDISSWNKRLIIKVSDNGNGISPELMKQLGKKTVESERGSGTALHNLNQRLVGLYDKQSALQIKSSSRGTTVRISIPLLKREEIVNESINS